MKRFIIIFGLMICSVVFAKPVFDDIVRFPDGKIHYMDRMQAIEYCNKRLMHLPTAREFAQYAIENGATGISEVPQTDYSRVFSQNLNGKRDYFYYNSSGYQAPNDDTIEEVLWTSSNNNFNSDYPFFAFSMQFAEMFYLKQQSELLAVRCVNGPYDVHPWSDLVGTYLPISMNDIPNASENSYSTIYQGHDDSAPFLDLDRQPMTSLSLMLFQETLSSGWKEFDQVQVFQDQGTFSKNSDGAWKFEFHDFVLINNELEAKVHLDLIVTVKKLDEKRLRITHFRNLNDTHYAGWNRNVTFEIKKAKN